MKCRVCHNGVEPVGDPYHWRHTHADKDVYCHTGDGSTAYPDLSESECLCGHMDGQHYDEVLQCEACECTHFLRPGQRLRDVTLPANEPT